MQFLSVILSLAVLASARPSPSYGNEMEAITGSQIAVGAPCNTGQRYCLGQIVTDLGMSLLSLPSHHITHALPCSSRPFSYCLLRWERDTDYTQAWTCKTYFTSTAPNNTKSTRFHATPAPSFPTRRQTAPQLTPLGTLR
jgi:hypothetical protein